MTDPALSTQDSALSTLLEGALRGEVRAAARLMTALESDSQAVPEIMQAIYPRAGQAHVIGVTGPPGAGKSSLVDKLAAVLRSAGKTVGIVAVDPSSPFSGGALLGDRIRMQDRFADAGVFIRSMASRGQPGGLAKASQNVVALMSAMGKDVVLVETIGVGQEEIDVIRVADTTVVVMVPGLGDAVQTMKAGLLEVADVFVVNKADRDGADRLFKDLNLMGKVYTLGYNADDGILNEIQSKQIIGTVDQRYDLQSGGYVKGCASMLFANKAPKFNSFVTPYIVTPQNVVAYRNFFHKLIHP